MTALETHDEKRLTDETGFNVWTGAGFWAVGNSIWSTPMMLMGQEFGTKKKSLLFFWLLFFPREKKQVALRSFFNFFFSGEPWQLSFKRNDFLRSRFVGSSQYNPNGEILGSLYRDIIRARLAVENRALRAQNNYVFVPKGKSFFFT